MKLFFARNLSGWGRLLRAVWGVALISGALLLWAPHRWIAVALVFCGAFGLYEAVRGWCILRACGINTRF